jgi:hypothetical protein
MQCAAAAAAAANDDDDYKFINLLWRRFFVPYICIDIMWADACVFFLTF